MISFHELFVWLDEKINWKWFVALIILIFFLNSLLRGFIKPTELQNGKFPLQQKWSAKMNDIVVAVLASENGIIFARSPYSLNALDASSGHLLWKFLLDDQGVIGQPITLNGIVYVCDDKFIYALNEKDGALIWQQNSIRYYKGGSVIDISNQLLLVHSAWRLSAVDTTSGKFLWDIIANSGQGFDGYIDDKENIVYNLYNGIQALDAATGQEIWRTNEDGSGFYENGIIYRTNETGVNAFNTTSQSYLWRTPMDISAPFMPNFVSGNELFAVSDNSHIFVFQKSDGAIKWEREFEGATSKLAIIDDTLFALHRFEQTIYAFDINTGLELGGLRISLPVFAAVDHQNFTSTKDTLIFSSGRIVYAYSK